MQSKIIILGAGLSGLTLAYYLQKENIPFLILEARDRIGGRINTLYGDGGKSVEMGATWFGKKHSHLKELLRELNIGYFPQHTSGVSLFETFSFAPPQKFTIPDGEEEQSYRIKGGSSNIINKLIEKIDANLIQLNTQVNTVLFKENTIEIKTNKEELFHCEKLISTLPPRLLTETINFEPELPENIKSLCQQTHTWMGESIKFCLTYKTPFWRNNGFSGAAFSQSSISSEMHDHSNENGTFHAIKGFLNPGSASMSQEERKKLLLAQLTKYYGEIAQEFIAYDEAVWSEEKYTYVPYDGYIRAHQNNGHALFNSFYFSGKLRIAGSETATHFPGYMDGAVCSAKEVFEQLISE